MPIEGMSRGTITSVTRQYCCQEQEEEDIAIILLLLLLLWVGGTFSPSLSPSRLAYK